MLGRISSARKHACETDDRSLNYACTCAGLSAPRIAFFGQIAISTMVLSPTTVTLLWNTESTVRYMLQPVTGNTCQDGVKLGFEKTQFPRSDVRCLRCIHDIFLLEGSI